MRRVLLAAVTVFLLVVALQAPTPAQAVVYSFLPEFGNHEPVALFLTGIALLSLAHLGPTRHHDRDARSQTVRPTSLADTRRRSRREGQRSITRRAA